MVLVRFSKVVSKGGSVVHVGNSNQSRTYAMFCELSCVGVLEMADYLKWVQNVKARAVVTYSVSSWCFSFTN